MKKLLIVAVLAGGLSACASNKSKPDESVNEPPTGAEAEVAMPKSAPIVRADNAPAAGGTVEAEGGADESTAVSRAELDAFLDKGPPYVLTIVTFEPVRRDGAFQGFQIVEVTREAREFITPQMRVGDIVTHVNGVRILKPDDLTQAWRSLSKADSVRVDFLRKSDPMHALWVVQ